MEILRSFSGDPSQLGIAEQFFMSLLAVPDYRLKLDCMILKEELDAAFETLLPQIDTVINACIGQSDIFWCSASLNLTLFLFSCKRPKETSF